VNVFVTGATGFVTGAVARRLLGRGDTVRALVRDTARARGLAGAQLIQGDLGNEDALRVGMDGVDAVIHGAAMYEIGLTAAQRKAMHEANVTGTERVLSLAADQRVPRVVYISRPSPSSATRADVSSTRRSSAATPRSRPTTRRRKCALTTSPSAWLRAACRW